MNSANVSSGVIGQASHQKDWEELTADEKVERLRDFVKTLSRQINDLTSENIYLRRAFKEHQHTDEVMVPFAEYQYHDNVSGHTLSNVKYI